MRPYLALLLLAGCHATSSPPPPTVSVPDIERPAIGAPPSRRDPRPAACIEASPCIVVRVGDDGWEVNGTVIEAANLRPTLNDLATAPASEPETRFRGIVWVDLPDDTPFPRWKSLVSALADSRAIDLVVSEGPRAVPVRGMTYVSQPALMMMAERDVAYVMVAPDGTPPANAPITTRRATPDDIATVASELCKGPTPCWTVIALEPDGMSFGELTTWLTALQPLLYKGRAARIMFDAEWAERLKRD